MKDKKERWKSVVDYEDSYEISTSGNIRSLDRIVQCRYPTPIKGKQLKPVKNGQGYLQVTLKGKIYLVHRLSAFTFLDNSENKPEVNHIDGDKTNNYLSNLEWCTKSENHIHAHKLGLKKSNFKPNYGSSNGNSKLTKEQVEEIKVKFNAGVSRKKLSHKYEVSITTISSINTGRTWGS